MPIIAFVLVFVMITPLSMADVMNPGVFSPDSKPYGYTFAQWSEKWWQWFLSIPAQRIQEVIPAGDIVTLGKLILTFGSLLVRAPERTSTLSLYPSRKSDTLSACWQ